MSVTLQDLQAQRYNIKMLVCLLPHKLILVGAIALYSIMWHVGCMMIAIYRIPEEYRKVPPKSSRDVTEGEGQSSPDREETGGSRALLGMIGKSKTFASGRKFWWEWKEVQSEMLASFNSEEFRLYAINIGTYWRCLRKKVMKSN